MTLQVRRLVKHFGGVRAVQDLSFEITVGECVALIGPNGAGKSTSFACIAGQLYPTQGEVWWAGQRIDPLSTAQRLERGVARTFQVAQTFEALTVRQNVQLLLQAPQRLPAWNVLEHEECDNADALLQRVGLQHLSHSVAQTLPYGAKKRLELAMALAGVFKVPGARLLLLDEPAAGLAGSERAALMSLVKSLAHDGLQAQGTAAAMALLYSEHNMDAVFGVADRVLVLMDGQLVAQGSGAEIAQNETVRSRYLGQPGQPAAVKQSTAAQGLDLHAGVMERSESDAAIAMKSVASQAVLSVQNLCAWYGEAQVLFDVSLQLAPGELLVLQGLNGAGKSTLLHAIMGLASRVTGDICYGNKRIASWPAHRRALAGLGFVAEDRRLFIDLSVQENLRVAARGQVTANEERVLVLFPALKSMLRRPVAQMSGGEQQMLAMARTLMTEPRLLLLDEPCEGIAPVLAQSIVEALLELKAQGTALLVAEQNDILASRADRVITMVAGQAIP